MYAGFPELFGNRLLIIVVPRRGGIDLHGLPRCPAPEEGAAPRIRAFPLSFVTADDLRLFLFRATPGGMPPHGFPGIAPTNAFIALADTP
jgi:hypothetical protein